jgi:hypothetical protein
MAKENGFRTDKTTVFSSPLLRRSPIMRSARGIADPMERKAKSASTRRARQVNNIFASENKAGIKKAQMNIKAQNPSKLYKRVVMKISVIFFVPFTTPI